MVHKQLALRAEAAGISRQVLRQISRRPELSAVLLGRPGNVMVYTPRAAFKATKAEYYKPNGKREVARRKRQREALETLSNRDARRPKPTRYNWQGISIRTA